MRASLRRRSRRRSGGPAQDVRPEDAERLLRSGVFDREYYEAQVGEEFASDAEAVEHYLDVGRSRHSPHPLLDLTSLTNWVRTRLRNERSPEPLLHYLQTKARDRRLGPLFDPRELRVEPKRIQKHPGGVLGWFLERHGADAPLPGRPDVTLAAVRPQLLGAARRLAEERDAFRPRLQDSWSADDEAAWRRTWSAAPLPEADGPLVSIVMPVRNRAQIVGPAIASVQAQTLDRWELVVVDDGSTDETLSVLEEAAAEDPRIRVVPESWRGVCAARNSGIEAAHAPYLAFLDSDNTWRPDFLQLALAAMHGQGLSAAYAALALRGGTDDSDVRYRAYEGSLDDLMVFNHIDLNVLMVRTELAREIGGFDESLRRWVDHDFAIRIAQRTDLRLLPFIAVDYNNSSELEDRITNTEPGSWQYVVLEKHWVGWDSVRSTAPQRVTGRVSVVIPTFNDSTMTQRAVEALLENSSDVELEIVVVDNGSEPAVALSLVAGLVNKPEVRVERLPRNLNFAAGSNYGFARSTGATVVFLNNDCEPRPGWLPPLVAALDDPSVLGAQPLLQYPHDEIQACGTAFPMAGHVPVHMLAGHPPEDAERMRNRRFKAVTAAALAMRAADVAELKGFDPIYVNGMEDVDLCLRAGERWEDGSFLFVPESRVTHHEGQTEGRGAHIPANRQLFMQRWSGRLPGEERWRWHELGFEIAHSWGDGGSVPSPRLLLVRRPGDPVTGDPPLRWGLRNPAWGGAGGGLWGDTHFLRSLAAGLRRLDQEVVSYRHGRHNTTATAYDDVVLGVRGLDLIAPVPGKVNVLWVISHPDLVVPEELMGFDLVYAASPEWAKLMTAKAGREIRTLLQATDVTLRADMSTPPGDGSSPVFVGGAPKSRGRVVVEAAVAADVPLVVHGTGWEGKIPEELLAGTYVDNDRLMQLYRDHGLVLADHWDDMREHGFLANRLFDAVASGARVVSDPIQGVEIFEGAVQPFHSAAELALLCSPAGRARFPDDDEMTRIADMVAREHSFDVRARQLVDDVQHVLAERRSSAAGG